MDLHTPQEETLFEAARKLKGASEQGAFLELVCKERPALIARVEVLLTASSGAENFFAEGAAALEESVLAMVGKMPLDRMTFRPAAITFAPTSKIVAASLSTDGIRLVDPATAGEFATLATNEGGNVIAFAFSRDGTKLAVSRSTSYMQLWELGLIREQLAEINLDWETPLSAL